MKKTFAFALSLALALGSVAVLASCGKTENAPETTASFEETAEVTEAVAEVSVEPETEAVSESATEAETETTTEAAETTEAAAKVPATKEEILKVYNDAINGAKSAKAGYNKSRSTEINNIDGGALLKIGLVQDVIGDFLGKGVKDYTNQKGKDEFMGKASLSASDVQNATCTENDGKYTIELTLADGQSSASESGISDSSPLKKSGLLVGEDDSNKFDYKSSQNIYVALNGTGESSVESGTGKTYGGKIKAVVNADSGNMESLEISFNFSVQLTNTKYTIVTVKNATGDASTVVKYSAFQY